MTIEVRLKMHARSYKLITSSLIIAGIVSCCLLIAPWAETQQSNGNLTPGTPTQVTAPLATTSSASTNAEAMPTASPIAAMRTKFETAANYAAFIHDAMQRPMEGGRFYALIAYNQCAEISTVDVDVPSPIGTRLEARDRALKVLADLKTRCNGVDAHFPDEITFLRALKISNSKGKPDALLIERGALIVQKGDTSAEDIQRAKKTGDPYLLAATLEVNADYLAEKIDPAYAQGRNRPTLYMAATAAVCEILGNCRENLRLLIPCVSGGTCEHDDYRDFLRKSLDNESKPLFDKTRQALLKSAGR